MHRFSKFIWLSVLFLLTAILTLLLLSGGITLYLAPRMNPFVIFGLVVLLILYIYQIDSLKSPVRCPIRIQHMLFLIPIVLFFTVMPSLDTLDALPNQNANIAYGKQPIQADSSDVIIEEESNIEISELDKDKDSSSDLTLDNNQDPSSFQPCTITEKDQDISSVDMFEEYLYISADQMIGDEVTMYGFVYKEDSFPENTIVVARRFMFCCAACAQLVGYYVKVEDSNDFLADQWIEVTGIVEMIECDMYGETCQLPIITNGTISQNDPLPLAATYIYP